MPFSLSTLQKIAQLVQSSDESQAVAEKVGLKKDALTTLFEAQQAGEEAVEAQAASCLEQLQKTYNELTSETVLEWLNAVDATEAFDTPELRLQAGEEGEEKLNERAEGWPHQQCPVAGLRCRSVVELFGLLRFTFRLRGDVLGCWFEVVPSAGKGPSSNNCRQIRN